MTRCRQLATAALAFVLVVGCTSGSGTPASRASSKGTPGSTFTVTVRGETPYLDPATATTVYLPSGGVVTAAGGIRCGIAGGVASTRCAADYPWGTADAQTTVAFTAAPDAASGFGFFAFAGACTGSAGCVVTGNADTFVAVRFARTREGLGAHANFSDPSVHGPEYQSFAASVAGALQCTSCHGADLLGQGIAVSCAACHPWPVESAGLTWDAAAWDRSRWR